MASRRWTIRSTKDLGRAVADIRRTKGLTQAQMASEVGLSRDSLAHLETGRSGRALEHLLRLLRRMGATITITIEDDNGET